VVGFEVHGTGAGSVISDRRSAPRVENPIKVWTPAVSPSGMAFYDGHAFPGWRGSLFLAALTMPGLVRLSTKGDRVTGEERLLMDKGRIAPRRLGQPVARP
jgi:aldose sugar dehydrogenase